MKMKFQWFFDIKTVKDTMQIITVSAGGDLVRKRLWPFFNAYKYYKLGNVSLKMVPSNTLPVDPLNLAYTDSDKVDPRDQVNPGLTRITNGEDIFEDLTGVSADKQRAMYYTMMLDTRWYKWNQQRGLFRKAYPKYWQIGQLHQDYFPGTTINLPVCDSTGFVHNMVSDKLVGNGTDPAGFTGTLNTYSDPHGIFQTGHKGRLGWMPTDGVLEIKYGDVEKDNPVLNAIPEIEVFKIITPPQYQTLYYFRCYVTEEVYFKGPIVNNAVTLSESGSLNSYRSLDVFHEPGGSQVMPNVGWQTGWNSYPKPPNDGGGSS